MGKQKIYELFVASVCCTLLGIELVGFVSWHFARGDQSPYHILKANLELITGLLIFTLLIALLLAKTMMKKITELKSTLLETTSFIQYLKVSRMWLLVVGVIAVIPILFLLVTWVVPQSNTGVTRIMMLHFLGIGPILTLFGVCLLIYTIVRMCMEKVHRR